jgi:hypothetical protein
MRSTGLDATIQSLLETVGSAFRLDQPLGSPGGIYSSLTRAVGDFHDLGRLDDDLSFVALRQRP